MRVAGARGLVAEQAGDRRELVVLGGQRVAGPAADQHDRVPDPGGEAPRPRAARPRRRPRRARPRPPRPAPPASWWCAARATAWPCPSCSSWTVHSTSDRPPGPSLRCSARSAPRGMRSASMRALIRRISRTACSLSPPAGYRYRSATAMNSAPSSASPDRELGAQQRLPLPRRGAALVVRPARRQAAHQRTLAAFRPQVGVHQQRRVRGRDLQQPAQFRAHRLRGLRRAPVPVRVQAGQRVVHEDHVGVAAEAGPRARRTGPSRSPRTGSAAGRAAPSRSSRSSPPAPLPAMRW